MLEYVPKNLITLEMCLAAIEQEGNALQYVPDELKTLELCLAAVESDYSALEYVHEDFETENQKFKSLCLEAVTYSEVSVNFDSIEYLDEVLFPTFVFSSMTKEALFLAGKVYLEYKKNKGTRSSILPDFFIGSHASVLKIPLLTRDVSRYKSYFPKLKIIAP